MPSDLGQLERCAIDNAYQENVHLAYSTLLESMVDYGRSDGADRSADEIETAFLESIRLNRAVYAMAHELLQSRTLNSKG